MLKKHLKAIDSRKGILNWVFILSFLFSPFLSLGQNKDLDKKADSLFTEAQIALTLDNDYSKAKTLFEKVVEIQSNNTVALFELSNIYVQVGDYSGALKHIQKALQYDPKNQEYLSRYADLLTQTASYTSAAKIYLELAEKSPDPSDYYYKAAYCYSMAKDYESALKTMEKLLPKNDEEKEQILKDKIKLLAHLGKKDLSSVAHELIELRPENPENYIMAAASETLTGKHEAAVATMGAAVDKFPKDPKIAQQAIFIFSKYAPKKLEQYYARIIADTQFNNKEKTIAFYPLVDLGMKDTGIVGRILSKQLSRLAFEGKGNSFAASFYGLILSANGKIEESNDAHRKAMKLDDKNILAWHGLMQNFEVKMQLDSLKYYDKIALERFPNNRIPYFHRALISYATGDKFETISSLETALQMKEGDTIITDFELASFLGDVYQSVKNNLKAVENYRKALNINPNAITLLNNFSYLLAVQSWDLDEALQMSEKTLKADPSEPMYLDTYGWILYKMKRYEEAKIYIQKSINNSKNPDPTLLDHLGDVEFALGNKKAATKQWKKALERDGANQEIKQKLESNKNR